MSTTQRRNRVRAARLSLVLVAAAAAAIVLFSGPPAAFSSDSPDTPGPRVALPPGWFPKTPDASSPAVEYGRYKDQRTAFDLVVERKKPHVDLMTHAQRVKAHIAETTKFTVQLETPLVERSVGGRRTIEYERTGTLGSKALRYRHIFMSCGDRYCNLTCWTTADYYNAAQPMFDDLVGRLK